VGFKTPAFYYRTGLSQLVRQKPARPEKAGPAKKKPARQKKAGPANGKPARRKKAEPVKKKAGPANKKSARHEKYRPGKSEPAGSGKRLVLTSQWANIARSAFPFIRIRLICRRSC